MLLLSGDAEAPVAALARQLGIAEWQRPGDAADKVAALDALRAEGRRVLMVGDGLNDAAALAAAHVSISPAAAVDASRSPPTSSSSATASTGYRRAGGSRAPRALRILENFAFAFAYNLVTVPVAFAGHASPLVAAVAMSVSSLVVCLNALRLGPEAPGSHR